MNLLWEMVNKMGPAVESMVAAEGRWGGTGWNVPGTGGGVGAEGGGDGGGDGEGEGEGSESGSESTGGWGFGSKRMVAVGGAEVG